MRKENAEGIPRDVRHNEMKPQKKKKEKHKQCLKNY